MAGPVEPLFFHQHLQFFFNFLVRFQVDISSSRLHPLVNK